LLPVLKAEFTYFYCSRVKEEFTYFYSAVQSKTRINLLFLCWSKRRIYFLFSARVKEEFTYFLFVGVKEEFTYFFSAGVKEESKSDNVLVFKLAHDLQFTVLKQYIRYCFKLDYYQSRQRPFKQYNRLNSKLNINK